MCCYGANAHGLCKPADLRTPDLHPSWQPPDLSGLQALRPRSRWTARSSAEWGVDDRLLRVDLLL
eukprot:5791797-Alexandrium_andersonii.AAC.1